MAAPMPVMTLPPVREMSGLNLSKCLEPSRRKVARVCERRTCARQGRAVCGAGRGRVCVRAREF